MYSPFHYQISEYDCVPTALTNAISFLFHRKEIPPMVIQHIYLYCLDTVGRNSRFGVGGTSKYAVRLVGNWLNSYRMKSFSVSTQFLEKEQISIEPEGLIKSCLSEGGVVLSNFLLTPRDEHYLMITAMDEEWLYCFDSYRRQSIRGMKGMVRLLDSPDGRSANLKIRRDWAAQDLTKRFCLGPMQMREGLLIWRTS
ncbi:hypothetical protein [uncultured Desulfobacter sp.]|uniref:hypothetical protein n=1 Tax=uncultured Desulfobacter sp. TaxID=240139 RepID=UPI002AABAF51|nr:hypothetical protein [uncultured Desulfobacter sp.]